MDPAMVGSFLCAGATNSAHVRAWCGGMLEARARVVRVRRVERRLRGLRVAFAVDGACRAHDGAFDRGPDDDPGDQDADRCGEEDEDELDCGGHEGPLIRL